MLPDAQTWEAAQAAFHWQIPERYNIGVDVCDRWADAAPERTALIHEDPDGNVQHLSFAALRDASNQAANCLRAHGIAPGERVAILLGQSPQTAIMHIAVYKSGTIAVPLFSLFGPQALEYRLRDSGARLLLTDTEGAAKIAAIRARLPQLETVLVTGDAEQDAPQGTYSFEAAMARESTAFAPVVTRAEDPALIIYTSGTTGNPKGALHAHRVLLGHLPGVEMSHGGMIAPDDVFWTPADWAWIGGLLDVLLPALHHGVPVVARRFAKFEAQAALELMARHRVRNVFLPPTALKMLRAHAQPWPRLHLRSVASGGESLGAEMLAWGRKALGVDINEFYGQTECNMVAASCARWFTARAGAIGRAVPGHDVQIVDAQGTPLAAGELGQIAVRAPDPVMFLGYWNNPEATAQKFAGGFGGAESLGCSVGASFLPPGRPKVKTPPWGAASRRRSVGASFLLTGDQGCMDEEGFIRFVARDDDVITSAGYRIGPGPIEDCLIAHPAVQMAAVVGQPDDARTEIVKAFVVLAPGFAPSETLTKQLQDHVRTRLAAHEYPRAIAYVESLPMTTTGKIIRHALREPQSA